VQHLLKIYQAPSPKRAERRLGEMLAEQKATVELAKGATRVSSATRARGAVERVQPFTPGYAF